jgi:hypothetical protein
MMLRDPGARTLGMALIQRAPWACAVAGACPATQFYDQSAAKCRTCASTDHEVQYVNYLGVSHTQNYYFPKADVTGFFCCAFDDPLACLVDCLSNCMRIHPSIHPIYPVWCGLCIHLFR